MYGNFPHLLNIFFCCPASSAHYSKFFFFTFFIPLFASLDNYHFYLNSNLAPSSIATTTTSASCFCLPSVEQHCLHAFMSVNYLISFNVNLIGNFNACLRIREEKFANKCNFYCTCSRLVPVLTPFYRLTLNKLTFA